MGNVAGYCLMNVFSILTGTTLYSAKLFMVGDYCAYQTYFDHLRIAEQAVVALIVDQVGILIR